MCSGRLTWPPYAERDVSRPSFPKGRRYALRSWHRLGWTAPGQALNEGGTKCRIQAQNRCCEPGSGLVVRGGIEPPTPRFSGAPNGSNLANASESGVPGESHTPPSCHDLSRIGRTTGAEGPALMTVRGMGRSPSPCRISTPVNSVILRERLRTGSPHKRLRLGEVAR